MTQFITLCQLQELYHPRVNSVGYGSLPVFALSSLYIKVCNNLLPDLFIGISFSLPGLYFKVTVMTYFSFCASSLMQGEGKCATVLSEEKTVNQVAAN